MFADLLYEKSSAAYEKHVLLIEEDSLEDKTEYCAYFAEKGFQIIRYENDLVYRVKYGHCKGWRFTDTYACETRNLYSL